jgi:hypothetical protein
MLSCIYFLQRRLRMAVNAPYARLVVETQQQTIKAIESGFEFASRVLELQKQYVLGVAGVVLSATPTAKD